MCIKKCRIESAAAGCRTASYTTCFTASFTIWFVCFCCVTHLTAFVQQREMRSKSGFARSSSILMPPSFLMHHCLRTCTSVCWPWPPLRRPTHPTILHSVNNADLGSEKFLLHLFFPLSLPVLLAFVSQTRRLVSFMLNYNWTLPAAHYLDQVC